MLGCTLSAQGHWRRRRRRSRKDGSEGRLHLEYVSRLKLKLKQLTDRHQLCRGGGEREISKRVAHKTQMILISVQL